MYQGFNRTQQKSRLGNKDKWSRFDEVVHMAGKYRRLVLVNKPWWGINEKSEIETRDSEF